MFKNDEFWISTIDKKEKEKNRYSVNWKVLSQNPKFSSYKVRIISLLFLLFYERDDYYF